MEISYASFAASPSGGPMMPLMVLDNLRSAYNVGSVFRTAASIAPAGVLLTGICCRPPNPKLGRTSRGTHSEVPWMYLPNLMEAVRWARGSGRQLVAVENGPGAASIFEASFDLSAAFVLGNEAEGVQRRVVEGADLRVFFPQTGSRDCINVSCMAAILAAEVQRRRILG
jgi:tRNA G18 (ribose-2'-O)-methylase SpoU